MSKELKIKSIIGENTDCEIHFDYQPYEAQTRTDPAVESEVTINAIIANNGDFLPQLSDEAIERYEIECYELIEK